MIHKGVRKINLVNLNVGSLFHLVHYSRIHELQPELRAMGRLAARLSEDAVLGTGHIWRACRVRGCFRGAEQLEPRGPQSLKRL